MTNLSEAKNHQADNFLQQIGHRVRGLRASRGMTRKMLAKDSSVSERYLANLELGKGNISINLLRQVARALRVSLADLMPLNTKKTPEQSLIDELIGRLPQKEQQSSLQLMYENFSSLNKNQTRIALIGLRGAGKTTLGKLLEQRRKLPFIKLTQEIETISGMRVSEIFSLSGQSGYRRMEEQALFKTLGKHESCCIETGGSIVSEPKELNLLLTTCLVIWVSTSPEEHMERVIAQGDMRPISNIDDAMDDLRAILTEREPYYQKAHIKLDTSGKTVEESFTELVNIVYQHSDQELRYQSDIATTFLN